MTISPFARKLARKNGWTERFCSRVLGAPLHHSPSRRGTAERKQLRRGVGRPSPATDGSSANPRRQICDRRRTGPRPAARLAYGA